MGLGPRGGGAWIGSSEGEVPSRAAQRGRRLPGASAGERLWCLEGRCLGSWLAGRGLGLGPRGGGAFPGEAPRGGWRCAVGVRTRSRCPTLSSANRSFGGSGGDFPPGAPMRQATVWEQSWSPRRARASQRGWRRLTKVSPRDTSRCEKSTCLALYTRRCARYSLYDLGQTLGEFS